MQLLLQGPVNLLMSTMAHSISLLGHSVSSNTDVTNLNSCIYFLPPSSFTFKMAFGNGTALMLKPERKENNENPSLQSPKKKKKKLYFPPCQCVCVQHMLGVMRVSF